MPVSGSEVALVNSCFLCCCCSCAYDARELQSSWVIKPALNMTRTSDGKESYKEIPNHKKAGTGQSAPHEQRILAKIAFLLKAELPTLIKHRKIEASANTGKVFPAKTTSSYSIQIEGNFALAKVILPVLIVIWWVLIQQQRYLGNYSFCSEPCNSIVLRMYINEMKKGVQVRSLPLTVTCETWLRKSKLIWASPHCTTSFGIIH